MEKKNGLTFSPPVARKKPKVDKKAQARLKEEKAIQDGGDAWRHFMDAKGFDDVERHDPCLLYQVYGAPPDPDVSTTSSDEDTSPEIKNDTLD
jgi:hypothetical protein